MTIRLVEDEADLRQILSLYLTKEGYDVICYEMMSTALADAEIPTDLWIIDIMLPDGNGIEVLKKVKEFEPVCPVIIISARGDRFDRLLGFEVGCDDYITKPFLPKELIYRVDKCLKDVQNNTPLLHIPPYQMDLQKRCIYFAQSPVEITSREFDLILFFINNKSAALSRELILAKIWGYDYFGSDRVVDNYIKNIRKKLPNLNIETIYGYGYRFNL